MLKNNIIVLFFLLPFFQAQLDAQTSPGDSLYHDSYVHELRFKFYTPDFYDTMLQLYNEAHAQGQNASYIPVAITVDGNTITPAGNTLDSVGIRMKGDFSFILSGNKKPLKVDINEFVKGQKINGIKKFNLAPAAGDPSFLRDKLASDLLLASDVPAARCAYTKVYFNDEYWGLYLMIEQIDDEFLKTHFGNKNGNLFKSRGAAYLEWFGDNQLEYEQLKRYELQTNETENDWSDLIAFIDFINNTSDEQFATQIESKFNVVSFLRNLAVQNYILNADNFLNGGNNYYLYHNTSTDKWEFIPWDHNYSMTDNASDVPPLDPKFNSEFPKLINRILKNSTFRQMYLNEVCKLVNDYGALNSIHQRITQLSDMIRPAVQTDNKKNTTNQQFENNIAYGSVNILFIGNLFGIKSFTEKRSQKLKSGLNESGIISCVISSNDDLVHSIPTPVFPNPFKDVINVSTDQNFKTIQIYDITGRTIYIENVATFLTKTYQITTENYPSGIYFMNINYSNEIQMSLRLIKN